MRRIVIAIVLTLSLALCSCPYTAALVDSSADNTAGFNLSIDNKFFDFDDHEPVSAVVVKVTGINADSDSRQSLEYRIESVLWRDVEDLPDFRLSGSGDDIKKDDRFVLFYGRHVSYWGDSFRPAGAVELDGDRIVTPVYGGGAYKSPMRFIKTLDELQARLDDQPAPDHSLDAQIRSASLIVEAKVLEVEGDGSVDYAFALVQPKAVYKGSADLRKELTIHPYRKLDKGSTYIFLLKIGKPELPGGAPILVASDREAPFIRASAKTRKEILKALVD